MKKELIETLEELCQLDIDAVFAYEQALEKIDDKEIYRNIDSFRDDHLRHIEDLNHMIKKIGGTAVKRSKDIKGFVIEGFTAIRSLTGTAGALSAMEGNEETTNKNYKKALEEHPNMEAEIRTLVEKNYEDEKRHLAYIQTALRKLDSES